MTSPLADLNAEQSARIGELIVTVHEAARSHADKEIALLRRELSATKSAWFDLWEKAGRPAGAPDQ